MPLFELYSKEMAMWKNIFLFARPYCTLLVPTLIQPHSSVYEYFLSFCLKAGFISGDRLWTMPLFELYSKEMAMWKNIFLFARPYCTLLVPTLIQPHSSVYEYFLSFCLKAGFISGDRLWTMPLFELYSKEMAMWKNIFLFARPYCTLLVPTLIQPHSSVYEYFLSFCLKTGFISGDRLWTMPLFELYSKEMAMWKNMFLFAGPYCTLLVPTLIQPHSSVYEHFLFFV